MYTLNSLKSNHLLLSALTIHHESFPKKNIGHSFHELDTIDSTNSYAMQKVQEKLAEHGTVYFAQHQTSGKGTRGKGWEAKSGENITISMVIDVKFLAIHQQFFFSAAIALAVFDFFFKYAGEGCSIKWPNDIYFNDSKAAGILIENSIQGNQWQWAIVGIGININQTDFGNDAPNAISLAQITGAQFDIITLAKELCNYVKYIDKPVDNQLQEELFITKKNRIFYTIQDYFNNIGFLGGYGYYGDYRFKSHIWG
jgi:BirA family biotin operon repressor/biotin-[acetyl-CoA-carboxylase] ligase